MIETERLVLRPWREADRAAMRRMCTDPEVMWDYGHVFTDAESDLRFARYGGAYDRLGYCRWVMERRSDGLFIGYCGILPIFGEHPLGDGVEIGWRMIRAAWGAGYACEAARAALRDGFERCGLTQVWSYTAADNARSQAVMQRSGMTRAAAKDYDANGKSWVVYVASPA